MYNLPMEMTNGELTTTRLAIDRLARFNKKQKKFCFVPGNTGKLDLEHVRVDATNVEVPFKGKVEIRVASVNKKKMYSAAGIKSVLSYLNPEGWKVSSDGQPFTFEEHENHIVVPVTGMVKLDKYKEIRLSMDFVKQEPGEAPDEEAAPVLDDNTLVG